MSQVSLAGLEKRYVSPDGEHVAAIDGVDLEIADGELLVLLGASGCGKSTTLRAIAGLERPDEGSITIGGRSVFDAHKKLYVPPHKRGLGMVFQSYALWPHKTVYENIAFPLKSLGMKQALREGWVEEAATLVECDGLLARYPSQLSGGQQQRVALARGLVARPSVILFDEPLSNLDARLRTTVRGQIHQLHDRLSFTGIYVTHDQDEALALGDRLAVMRLGKVEQIGTPREVFSQPATEFVAAFMGYSNRLAARSDGDRLLVDDRPLRGLVPLPPADVTEVSLRFRPEDSVWLRPDDSRLGDLCIFDGLTLAGSAFAGRATEMWAESGESHLRCLVAGDVDETDQRLTVAVRPEHLLAFDGSGAPIEPSWTRSDRSLSAGMA